MPICKARKSMNLLGADLSGPSWRARMRAMPLPGTAAREPRSGCGLDSFRQGNQTGWESEISRAGNGRLSLNDVWRYVDPRSSHVQNGGENSRGEHGHTAWVMCVPDRFSCVSWRRLARLSSATVYARRA